MNQQGFGQQHNQFGSMGSQQHGSQYGGQGGQGGGFQAQGGYGQSPYEHGAFGGGSQQGVGASQYGGGHGSQYGYNPQSQGGQMGQMGHYYGGGQPQSQWGQGGWGQGGYGGQQQSGQRTDVNFNPQTMDKDYNLISVLYHALQAVDVCAQYCEDARREGSSEIAAFLDQTRQQNLQISQRAKELLFRQRQI